MRLYKVSGPRSIVCQTLLYTGQRKDEVYRLRVSKLDLNPTHAAAFFRESTTKDKANRWVTLPLPLAAKLREIIRPDYPPDRRVFWHLFPNDDTFHKDLENAKIPRVGKDGDVVHFHSFRKSHATLSAKYGVAQKATQETLGHSDANLTANIYAQISAESLRNELAKLPWIDAHICAHESGASSHLVAFPDKQDNRAELLKAAGAEGLSHHQTQPVTPGQNLKMVDLTGLEPVTFSMSRKRSNQLS